MSNFGVNGEICTSPLPGDRLCRQEPCARCNRERAGEVLDRDLDKGSCLNLSTASRTIEREDGTEIKLQIALDKKTRRIDTSYEIYLALYQAITGPEERQKLYRELSSSLFDLIVN